MEDWSWDRFLEQESAAAVPEELFEHVEASLFNGIKPGMLLEVAHRSTPDVYWIAEIGLVCGHLLRVKFIGADSSFWCDITTAKVDFYSRFRVHPLGWCGKFDELVEPPGDVYVRHGDAIIELMKRTLLDGVSASEEALANKGLSPVDRVARGIKLEVQSALDPYRYWIATVCDNVGGRLLLRYDGSDGELPRTWLFHSSARLCAYGFVTNKGSPWQFKYPGKVNRFSCKSKLSAQLRLCAEESIKDPTPADLFQPKLKTESHNFIQGMKLEALDPKDMKSVRPATVVKVFNSYHFLVVIDDHLGDYEDTKMAWLCDLMHPYIFPVNWAASTSMPFTEPKIWDTSNEFDWDEYLTQTSSVPAPEYCFGPKSGIDRITVNMKLEAVHPMNDNEIHAANIFRIVEHLIGLELLSTGEKIWYAQNSDQIFPVGWCETNNYELQVPRAKVAPSEPPPETPPARESAMKLEEWCERIYFNYKCYAGPVISRNKLAQLPKHVGPGPLSLVLKEVLNMMISASYKPAKMLKDWETEGDAEEGMRLERLKAKLKSSTYHAYVQVATKHEQVQMFCRDMCVKMQACPYLFGPVEFPGPCPETCQLVDKCRFQLGGDRRGRGRAAGKRRRKGLHFMTVRAQERRAALEADGGRHKEPAPPDSGNESETSLASTPRQSEPGTRPASPDGKRAEPADASRRRRRGDTDSERESSRSTASNKRNISDVSDGEEPELRKLKFGAREPRPTDNGPFERATRRRLASNPLQWSVQDVHDYLSGTDDCGALADELRAQEIDGAAFIQLNLPTIREFLHVRSEYALLLCKHITAIKWHYIVNYQQPGLEA